MILHSCSAHAPARPSVGPRAALEWLDRKSSASSHTHGDLPDASYVQAGIGGAVEGFALGGVSGGVSACVASMAGIFVERRTGKGWAGVAAGVVAGTALGAGVAWATGRPDILARTVAGGLLGGFATLGGAASASVRDASDMGAVASGFLLPGASKAAGGVASALATTYGQDLPVAARSALGATLGVGLGAAFGALGGSPVSPAILMAGAAFGGGFGPLVGPRFGQFIRNISQDTGRAMEAGLLKTGILKAKLSPSMAGCLGALPAGMLSEFGKSYVYSDGNLLALALGGVSQAIQLADIFTNSNPNNEDEVYAAAT